MVARLVRSVDFEQALRTRSRMSSAHFAVHHVPACPAKVARRTKNALEPKLSTGLAPDATLPVDDFQILTLQGLWLGVVVPKRHARRSVMRSLLKRQIRSVATRFDGRLAAGLWVVRLRAPFDKSRFVSAASDELRAAARSELESLFDGVVRRMASGA